MANIRDYLAWRGDLTWEQSHFGQVDNLILSEFAYVDLKGIIPSPQEGGSVMLSEAAEVFFNKHSIKELEESISFVREAPFLFRDMANTQRFAYVQLSNYVDVVDEDAQMQFAAFHVKLGDGTTYVVFRGTDDTLVGWKEDFNMGFISPVPSQIAAVKYLNDTIKAGAGKLRLGGHSKGGNLAIYAAVMCNARVKKRIIEIYNNDGPGYSRDFVEAIEYQKLIPKIKHIIPYHSVVGMLLERGGSPLVVESSQIGIMQHDPMSWQVMGEGFVVKDKVSRASQVLSDALTGWINGLNVKEREDFVEALFAIIKASGATTLTDLRTDKLNSAGAGLKLYASMDKDSRKMIKNILQTLTGEFDKVLGKKSRTEEKSIKSVSNTGGSYD